ncbi:hypothetical protein FSP39_010830 [Pinctada imbricata]|uniref:Superoxide dismutase n=1 Tax=Pinctada imbricata TaxID=66713 RepID=A0AA88YEK9_PINIB|nr:hypothetical protein FSP39_010830 [Pinctada imbricata]
MTRGPRKQDLITLGTHGVVLVGKFGMRGVTGTVSLSQTTGDTTATVSVQGLQNQNSWHFREVRTIYDVADKCSDAQLGRRYGQFGGNVPSSGTSTFTITKSDLDDLNSLTGRSILFVDQTTNTRVCATLEEDAPYKTTMAVFPTAIAGHVVMRQLASSPSSHTSLFTNLYHVQDTASAAESNVTLHVYDGSVTETNDTSERCNNIGTSIQTIGTVTVGNTKDSSITGMVVSNLALSSNTGVVKKVLGVVAPNGTVLGCAIIRQVMPRTATTMISRDGVKGMFQFTQNSPFDPTHSQVDITGLAGIAGGYHVHEWPVPQRLTKDQAVCSDSSVSGHFNPFMASNFPPAATGTDDQYEVGDLSGKYGLLTGRNSLNANYTDWNLPLFGANSIIGRSIVIHKTAQSARWVCANVEDVQSYKIARATFHYPVIGYMIFKQPVNDWQYADTQIYVELNYGDGTATSSVNHDWHVHQTTIGDDMDASSGRCMSVGGHYNPYNVDLHGNYQTVCSTNSPLRCEVGDLSKKHGRLDIRTSGGGMQRAFFTDVDLPLSGPLSIVGKSIVIHAPNSGSARFSCANILPVPERKVKVDTWYKNSQSSVSGSVVLTENTDGVLTDITTTEFNLANLASEANGLHVHQYPVDMDKTTSSPCAASSVGGHFIPYEWNIANSPSNGNGSDDQYEVGDLSGRYGSPLLGQTSYRGTFHDSNLPLRGPLSVVGRSIVIHKSDNQASRWVCGDIVEDTSSTSGKLYQSKATFNQGDIQGYIHLRQYFYSNGGSSDTEILVDLRHTQTSGTTTGHNWHAHVSQVNGDATSGCNTPGGHYNPFHSNTTSGYTECSFSNPLRCELGDQSGKVGQYDVGGGRKFFTDVNLPIIGRYGVTGRSFVVHGPNNAAARVACADILPIGMPTVSMSFPVKNPLDKNNFRTVLAQAMSTDTWNIMVEEVSSSSTASDPQCMQASVTLLGTNADTLKQSLESLISTKDSKLGAYLPCNSGMLTILKHPILQDRLDTKQWINQNKQLICAFSDKSSNMDAPRWTHFFRENNGGRRGESDIEYENSFSWNASFSRTMTSKTSPMANYENSEIITGPLHHTSHCHSREMQYLRPMVPHNKDTRVPPVSTQYDSLCKNKDRVTPQRIQVTKNGILNRELPPIPQQKSPTTESRPQQKQQKHRDKKRHPDRGSNKKKTSQQNTETSVVLSVSLKSKNSHKNSKHNGKTVHENSRHDSLNRKYVREDSTNSQKEFIDLPNRRVRRRRRKSSACVIPLIVLTVVILGGLFGALGFILLNSKKEVVSVSNLTINTTTQNASVVCSLNNLEFWEYLTVTHVSTDKTNSVIINVTSEGSLDFPSMQYSNRLFLDLRIGFSSATITLNFTVDCSDDGLYVCHAYADGQHFTGNGELRIREPPTKPSITVPIEVVENRPIEYPIICRANVGFPRGRLLWMIKPPNHQRFFSVPGTSSSSEGKCGNIVTNEFVLTPSMAGNGTTLKCHVSNDHYLTGNTSDEKLSDHTVLRVVPASVCQGIAKGTTVRHPYRCDKYINCTSEDDFSVFQCPEELCYDIITGQCGQTGLSLTNTTAFLNEGVTSLTCRLQHVGRWSGLQIYRETSTGRSVLLVVKYSPKGPPIKIMPDTIKHRYFSVVNTKRYEVDVMLWIYKLNCNDNGQYKCRADIPFELPDVVGFVNLIVKPETPVISAPTEIVDGRGLRENFTCKANVGYPGGNLYWEMRPAGRRNFTRNLPFIIEEKIDERNCSRQISKEFSLIPSPKFDGLELRCVVENENALEREQFLMTEYVINVIPADTCNTNSSGPLPHPSDCRQYIQCTNDYLNVQRCSQSLCFNPETLECDLPEPVDQTPIDPNSPCKPNKNGVYFPHPFVCNIYFWCVGGQEVIQRCPLGTLYKDEGQCTFDTNSNSHCFKSR